MDSYATGSPRQTVQHDLRRMSPHLPELPGILTNPAQASSPNLKSSFGSDIFKIIGGQKRTNRGALNILPYSSN